LIFESVAIVRRVWVFPRSWASMRDAELGALLDGGRVAIPEKTSLDAADEKLHPALRAATRALLRAEEMVRVASDVQTVSRALRAERSALLDGCRAERDAMRASVRQYARSLKEHGVEEESALRLIATAIEEALPSTANLGSLSKDLVVDGVRVGREEYVAA
jgi:hypothetical protein